MDKPLATPVVVAATNTVREFPNAQKSADCSENLHQPVVEPEKDFPNPIGVDSAFC
jgi:hypothetical protein